MQQLLPDIKTLYQHKYIRPSSLTHNNPSPQRHTHLLQRAQRFQEKTMGTSQQINRPVWIKIMREKPLTQRTPASSNLSLTSPKPANRATPSLSTSGFKSHHLVQQILQISHQQLSDLQSSLGGEKTLMNLLNNFFQKRHLQQQTSRSQRKQSNTSHTPFSMRYHQEEKERSKELRLFREQREERDHNKDERQKSRQYRIRKDQLQKKEQKIKEKDLAPWSVHDIEFT